LPHSEIPGSTVARTSPELFAACHVLHRLSVPRHSPDALLIELAHAQPQARQTRDQTTEIRERTGHCRPTSISAFRAPVTWLLEPRHKPSLRRGSRPGVFAYPCPGPARRIGQACFTVTTRFTMSTDQRTEIRGQTTRSAAPSPPRTRRSPMPEDMTETV
jgi:hypothetical protein